MTTKTYQAFSGSSVFSINKRGTICQMSYYGEYDVNSIYLPSGCMPSQNLYAIPCGADANGPIVADINANTGKIKFSSCIYGAEPYTGSKSIMGTLTWNTRN